jgi:hypothetical protein
VLTAAADLVVPSSRRATNLYTLVYRSVDHASLRDLCKEITKQTMSAKYAQYEPPGGFGQDIKSFANAVIGLQEKRHSSDYGPLFRVTKSDTILAILAARTAINHLQGAPSDERLAFLSLLLFKAR